MTDVDRIVDAIDHLRILLSAQIALFFTLGVVLWVFRDTTRNRK